VSRIFSSHSSANNAEATALRDWLLSQGFDDLFLDLDPERGLKAGQKWQAELKRAASKVPKRIGGHKPRLPCRAHARPVIFR
jgi:hypothetical protein